jgi:hypothetical protein
LAAILISPASGANAIARAQRAGFAYVFVRVSTDNPTEESTRDGFGLQLIRGAGQEAAKFPVDWTDPVVKKKNSTV